MHSHGETNVTSGASVDLANIDATRNTNKANGARLTAPLSNRLSASGKELKRQSGARIVFDCRTANDPAMMSSTVETNTSSHHFCRPALADVCAAQRKRTQSSPVCGLCPRTVLHHAQLRRGGCQFGRIGFLFIILTLFRWVGQTLSDLHKKLLQ